MGTEATSTIKLFETDGYDDEVLRTQNLCPPLITSFHIRSVYTILMTDNPAPSRSNLPGCIAVIRTNFATARNTPPPVDKYQYRNTRISFQSPSIPPSEKIVAHSPVLMDTQTYSRPADIQRGLFDQEKGGKRPEPTKPTPPDTKKPETEGTKGKRKGKGPRTEGLVHFIMQKRKISLV